MSIATITALVDDKMRTTSLGGAADTDARDRAVVQALVQYSTDEPQDLVVELTGVSGYTMALPSGWVAGRSELHAVEWPVDRVPMATVPATVQVATGQVLLADALSVATVRLHFTAPHADDASTVPAHHVNAVACWAAAELCRQIATQKGMERDATINAMAVNGGSASGELARRAKEWVAVYRVALGLPDPDKAAAGVGGAQPAGVVVSWGARRMRGRFSGWVG